MNLTANRILPDPAGRGSEPFEDPAYTALKDAMDARLKKLSDALDAIPPENSVAITTSSASSLLDMAAQLCMHTRETTAQLVGLVLWFKVAEDIRQAIHEQFEILFNRAIDANKRLYKQLTKLTLPTPALDARIRCLRAYVQNEMARQNRVASCLMGVLEFDERMELQWGGFRRNRHVAASIDDDDSSLFEEKLLSADAVKWDPAIWKTDLREYLSAIIWTYQNIIFETRQFALELHREVGPFIDSAEQQSRTARDILERARDRNDTLRKECRAVCPLNFLEEQLNTGDDLLELFVIRVCAPLEHARSLAVEKDVRNIFRATLPAITEFMSGAEGVWVEVVCFRDDDNSGREWTMRDTDRYWVMHDRAAADELSAAEQAEFKLLKLLQKRHLTRTANTLGQYVTKVEEEISAIETRFAPYLTPSQAGVTRSTISPRLQSIIGESAGSQHYATGQSTLATR